MEKSQSCKKWPPLSHGHEDARKFSDFDQIWIFSYSEKSFSMRRNISMALIKYSLSTSDSIFGAKFEKISIKIGAGQEIQVFNEALSDVNTS